jgi:hypothetical protein
MVLFKYGLIAVITLRCLVFFVCPGRQLEYEFAGALRGVQSGQMAVLSQLESNGSEMRSSQVAGSKGYRQSVQLCFPIGAVVVLVIKRHYSLLKCR